MAPPPADLKFSRTKNNHAVLSFCLSFLSSRELLICEQVNTFWRDCVREATSHLIHTVDLGQFWAVLGRDSAVAEVRPADLNRSQSEFHSVDSAESPRPIVPISHFQSFLSRFLSIRELSLNFCHHVTDVTLISLLHTLKFNAVNTQITHLHLRYCYAITNSAVDAIVELLPNIQVLVLSRCANLNDVAFQRLSQLPFLLRLDMSRTALTDSSLLFLESSLPTKAQKQEQKQPHSAFPSLKVLNLQFCAQLTFELAQRIQEQLSTVELELLPISQAVYSRKKAKK